MLSRRVLNQAITAAARPNQAALINNNLRIIVSSNRQFTQTWDADKFTNKNIKLGRPMSPHLTIYRPELTSILSICHRVSGGMWTGVMSGFAIGMAVSPHNFSYYIEAIKASEIITPSLIVGGKFFVCYPFVYHTINGVRHLAWDRAMNLTIPQVYSTGYAVLGVSTVLTLLLSQL